MKLKILPLLIASSVLLLSSCADSTPKDAKTQAVDEASAIFEQQIVDPMNKALYNDFTDEQLDELTAKDNIDTQFASFIYGFMDIGKAAADDGQKPSGLMKGTVYKDSRSQNAPEFYKGDDNTDAFKMYACVDISEMKYGDQSFLEYTGKAQEGYTAYDFYVIDVTRNDKDEYKLTYANAEDEGMVDYC